MAIPQGWGAGVPSVSSSIAVISSMVAIISAPGFDFTKVPKKTFKFAEFLHRIGSLKNKPESWKDAFFPTAHGLPGN